MPVGTNTQEKKGEVLKSQTHMEVKRRHQVVPTPKKREEGPPKPETQGRKGKAPGGTDF